MSFHWRYPDGGTSEPFPSQSDAETWMGESWRQLLSDGVQDVTLMEDVRVVYGPMSLRPAT
jgi:hypothetical protein